MDRYVLKETSYKFIASVFQIDEDGSEIISTWDLRHCIASQSQSGISLKDWPMVKEIFSFSLISFEKPWFSKKANGRRLANRTFSSPAYTPPGKGGGGPRPGARPGGRAGGTAMVPGRGRYTSPPPKWRDPPGSRPRGPRQIGQELTLEEKEKMKQLAPCPFEHAYETLTCLDIDCWNSGQYKHRRKRPEECRYGGPTAK